MKHEQEFSQIWQQFLAVLPGKRTMCWGVVKVSLYSLCGGGGGGGDDLPQLVVICLNSQV